MIYIALSIITAYLVGAIPTAYIFGRILKGIDIREYGSGNVGATNVVRAVGKIPGIIVLAIDFLKGVAVVTVIPPNIQRFFPEAAGSQAYGFIYILAGAAAIAGHIWPVFLKFKGGKGVATSAGVMAGLSPWILLAGLGIWAVVFSIWKYVSLASVVAAVALPVLAVLAGKKLDFIIFCAVLCLVGVCTHRSNIKRLIQGTEGRIVKVKKS
ncbi:MAG: acyl-phosphate glycerol 3-phosphate acyltransferase [Candidatus Makaraimicrobium thalassicum]|nr:MAG: acyl-phosphate glycerol 3-phosphate acyltransferase [Candidatus Omnitrophota bacterium]